MNDYPVGIGFLMKVDYTPMTVNQLLLGRLSTVDRDSNCVAEDSLETTAGQTKKMKNIKDLEDTW